MSLLTVRRSFEQIIPNKKVNILIDGVDFANLSNGQSKVLHLPPGEHDIEAKMKWLGSKKQTFVIKEDGYASFSFKVKSNKRVRATNIATASLIPILIFLLIPYTGLYFSLLILSLVYLSFYLLVGRKNYLEIEKVASYY